MTYKIVILPIAQSQLEKLDKNIQERILDALERIRVRPYNFVKKLAGSPYFRLRVGDYRVVLDIRNDALIVFVIEVGHRKNIYK